MNNPMKYLLLTAAILAVLSVCHAQSGCTDPQAINYNPDAVENDGSCNYPPTSYQLTPIALLPDALKETSGLAYFDQQLWSSNDANNTAELFLVDTLNGTILRQLSVAGTQNIDWEELAEDENHLYIGDFGNNMGNRTDLRILKITKSDMAQSSVVSPESIEFSFSDQTDFSSNENSHNYDCEAFFFYQDSLYLFSKNWLDHRTRLYSLPATPGVHVARLRDSFNVSGLISGATINERGEVLLLGYNGLSNFLWLLFDFQGDQFFSGNKRRIDLGGIGNNGQTEGISFTRNGEGYISAERISIGGAQFPARLLAFESRQWTDPLVDAVSEAAPTPKLTVFPNPAYGAVHIKLSYPLTQVADIQLFSASGQLIFSDKMAVGQLQLHIPPEGLTAPSVIVLVLKNEEVKLVKKLVYYQK